MRNLGFFRFCESDLIPRGFIVCTSSGFFTGTLPPSPLRKHPPCASTDEVLGAVLSKKRCVDVLPFWQFSSPVLIPNDASLFGAVRMQRGAISSLLHSQGSTYQHRRQAHVHSWSIDVVRHGTIKANILFFSFGVLIVTNLIFMHNAVRKHFICFDFSTLYTLARTVF